jgi:hypothetical protein
MRAILPAHAAGKAEKCSRSGLICFAWQKRNDDPGCLVS